ncbi:MAG: DNA primase [Verrucomicrobia bacterium]|nr:DNA primase [Verrucomicrobiota bacterium]
MGYSAETIEKVRRASDLVEVAGAIVQLRRVGTNFRGLSPFKKEKTPSFYVHPDKQFFKCFSSGSGGDVFRFIMMTEGLDFPAAVRGLAARAGVSVDAVAGGGGTGGGDGGSGAERERLRQIHASLALHWRDLLASDPSAEEARTYLKEREIPTEWIARFGLGFAPAAWTATLDWGKRNGFTEEEMIASGVALRAQSGRVYDRFRNRLMFPILDEGARVIAFSGRVLAGAGPDEPKYVNSPETVIFKKGRVLFGFDRARRAMAEAGRAIVVEGQLDVLRSQAAGFTETVAPLGTGFTEEHAKLIGRFAKEIVICLDADAAGDRAAGRLGGVLVEEGQGWGGLAKAELGVKVVRLPAGDDPDSLIRKGGADAFREKLDEAVDFLDFFIDWQTKQEGETPGGRRRVVEAVAKLLGRVESAVSRAGLVARASSRLGLGENLVMDEVEKARGQAAKIAARSEAPPGITVGKPLEVHPVMRELFLLVLGQPGKFPDMERKVDEAWLKNLGGEELYLKIRDLYRDDGWTGLADLLPHLQAEEQDFVTGLEAGVWEKSPEEGWDGALEKLTERLEGDFLRREAERLSARLRSMSQGDPDAVEVLRQQGELLKKRARLTPSTSKANA